MLGRLQWKNQLHFWCGKSSNFFIGNPIDWSKLQRRSMVRYLRQTEAVNVDKDLFEKYRFSVDQLMELAGQSCAIAVAKTYPIVDEKSKNILICCGPGNNGGDGLVCARHLAVMGYEPRIYYPKRPKNPLYENLLHQCRENNIATVEDTQDLKNLQDFALVVDALFGFSFKPPVRAEFNDIMEILEKCKIPICSVDIPSGWDVEAGPPASNAIHPETLISLTAPKLCSKHFSGKFHYLGGRFVPKKLEREYDLDLPQYPGTDLIVLL